MIPAVGQHGPYLDKEVRGQGFLRVTLPWVVKLLHFRFSRPVWGVFCILGAKFGRAGSCRSGGVGFRRVNPNGMGLATVAQW